MFWKRFVAALLVNNKDTLPRNSKLHSLKCNFEFGNVGFRGEGETGVPGEKPLGTEQRTNNKPHIWRRVPDRINPGPYFLQFAYFQVGTVWRHYLNQWIPKGTVWNIRYYFWVTSFWKMWEEGLNALLGVNNHICPAVCTLWCMLETDTDQKLTLIQR